MTFMENSLRMLRAAPTIASRRRFRPRLERLEPRALFAVATSSLPRHEFSGPLVMVPTDVLEDSARMTGPVASGQGERSVFASLKEKTSPKSLSPIGPLPGKGVFSPGLVIPMSGNGATLVNLSAPATFVSPGPTAPTVNQTFGGQFQVPSMPLPKDNLSAPTGSLPSLTSTASPSILGAPITASGTGSGSFSWNSVGVGGSLPLSPAWTRSLPATGSLAMGPLPLLSAGPYGGVLEQGDLARTVEARVATAVDLALIDLPRGKAPSDRAVDDGEPGTVEWMTSAPYGSVAVVRGPGGFPLLGASLTPAHQSAGASPIIIGRSSPDTAPADTATLEVKEEKDRAREVTLSRVSVFAGLSLVATFASRVMLPQLLEPTRAEKGSRSILRRWLSRASV